MTPEREAEARAVIKELVRVDDQYQKALEIEDGPFPHETLQRMQDAAMAKARAWLAAEERDDEPKSS